MAHTVHDQKKLLLRIRRIRGQVNAVEKTLLAEKDCSTVLVTLAACRGAINSPCALPCPQSEGQANLRAN
jgi:DNA-binding FrmR family transcriptional regulator